MHSLYSHKRSRGTDGRAVSADERHLEQGANSNRPLICIHCSSGRPQASMMLSMALQAMKVSFPGTKRRHNKAHGEVFRSDTARICSDDPLYNFIPPPELPIGVPQVWRSTTHNSKPCPLLSSSLHSSVARSRPTDSIAIAGGPGCGAKDSATERLPSGSWNGIRRKVRHDEAQRRGVECCVYRWCKCFALLATNAEGKVPKESPTSTTWSKCSLRERQPGPWLYQSQLFCALILPEDQRPDLDALPCWTFILGSLERSVRRSFRPSIVL
jgi:hypothetical protein